MCRDAKRDQRDSGPSRSEPDAWLVHPYSCPRVLRRDSCARLACPGFCARLACPGFCARLACPGFCARLACPGFCARTPAPGLPAWTRVRGLVPGLVRLDSCACLVTPIVWAAGRLTPTGDARTSDARASDARLRDTRAFHARIRYLQRRICGSGRAVGPARDEISSAGPSRIEGRVPGRLRRLTPRGAPEPRAI
jgi:hypothetical protein